MGEVATIDLMGLPIDGFTADRLTKHLIQQSRARMGGYLMTPNLDNLRKITRNRDLFDRAMRADIRVADGMPLIWASRIQGTPLPGRVAGSDLITGLADAIASSGGTVFLLGGSPGTADRAADVMRARANPLRVVGTYCPDLGFERRPDEVAEAIAAVRAASPDFVFIGLPFEKASVLADEACQLLPSTWFVGLGISFSFVCGDVARAPRWMQRTGLEWFHRLLQEPGRLSRRYLAEDVPFALRLLFRSLRRRRRYPSHDGPHSRRPKSFTPS